MNAPNWLWFIIALLAILAVLWLVGIRFNAEFVLPAIGLKLRSLSSYLDRE